MISCGSCKNRTSDERCSNRPLKGLILCGKHARVKNPRLWKDVNNLDCKAVSIQKIWRGYAIRSWMKLAGPGVLSRSICHNDEELVTFDDKKSVKPFDYFAFEENGKIYWFDVRSLAENSLLTLQPINPYTRELLTIDTRKRLRYICVRRHRKKIENLHNSGRKQSVDEIISSTWIYICRVIEENGFHDMSHLYFTALNRTQLYIFTIMLRQDMVAWAAEHTSKQSRRHRYIYWLKRLTDEYMTGIDGLRLSFITARVLTTILNDSPEEYQICFNIMSALHRL
uniref:Uncharacterized protein n=1 Tax=viral metagenome TaxID=1070528 RepID=A0A6C0EQ77_9ZZZZ